MTDKTKSRKNEIIKTAMQLFSEKGYEQTSMRDIAKKMNVSLGLCYRYFDSKQIIFKEAMNQYVTTCCNQFLKVIDDKQLSFKEKIDRLYDFLANEHAQFSYQQFFHQIENEQLHEELSMKICKFMYPHLLQACNQAISKKEIAVTDPDVLISFITYGHVGVLSNCQNHLKSAKLLKQYIYQLLEL
ncbi:TetR/AcrR family transcriptional regulator [uncultured Thomasclavelia sp.]|uniref:TetR/AcrR family transcriptional regulator n=1 Tax=uncultured Thomasclavelia sp. TaxID=3025759 RepID=UPI0025F91C8D|nr:TetR/AcrR family transcriptional regulator [uncultured Thomasclavelia sp.]